MLSKITAGLSRVLHGAEHHRAYVYRVATTIGGLLVTGGVIDGTREGYLIAALGAVLGLPNGLAAANTSTRPAPRDVRRGFTSEQERLDAGAAIHAALLAHKRNQGGKDLGLS
jgi:hypothetical protein